MCGAATDSVVGSCSDTDADRPPLPLPGSKSQDHNRIRQGRECPVSTKSSFVLVIAPKGPLQNSTLEPASPLMPFDSLLMALDHLRCRHYHMIKSGVAGRTTIGPVTDCRPQPRTMAPAPAGRRAEAESEKPRHPPGNARLSNQNGKKDNLLQLHSGQHQTHC